MLTNVLLWCCLLLPLSSSWGAEAQRDDLVWSGKVTLDTLVDVPADKTLTIKPGTEILVSEGGGVTVRGTLHACGTVAQPIVFRPASTAAQGRWSGISLQDSNNASLLEQVRIVGGVQGVAAYHSTLKIVDSMIEQGGKGLILNNGAQVMIEGVTIRAMSQTAIEASEGVQGRIERCRIEMVEGVAIQAPTLAGLSLRNNSISKAKVGIYVSGDFQPVEGNEIDHCEIGIGVTRSGGETAIRHNKVSDCGKGIACLQFASPMIENNLVEGCEEGISCGQSSSPTIRHNRIARNQRGLACVQMCNPVVSRNDFSSNATAIYLHLSSYAKIHDNNFEDNRVHVELDNMSYDWEVRAAFKPTRNLQAQNDSLVQQGRATAKTIQVKVDSAGYVDARDNYWGGAATAEMEKHGVAANITTVRDGYDIPVLTYEGWPGEYKVDKVRYEGWKKERIPDAYQP